MKERNAYMADKNEVMMSVDPAMLAKFQASTHVSSKFQFFDTFDLCMSSCRCQGREFCDDEGLLKTAQNPGPDQG